MNECPHIGEINGKRVLMIKGTPFVMLAGEVHNSSSSSLEYMEEVWKKAENLHMNSLLIPVSWELTEPEEGIFDFELVDGLIHQARSRDMKIGFLWFGAWKNAQCYYAPEWVKIDTKRFQRAQVEKGKNFVRLKEFYGMAYSTLSYLCSETREADAKAFSMLMKHIREIDEEENTVVLVQVENETGLMGAGREQSDYADALFESPVPQDFADYMKSHTDSMVTEMKEAVKKGASSGTWKEVFGSLAEEIFSAYYVAGYVHAVASAGKAAYPIPMTANCWLDKGEKPGKYPTGGPTSRVMEVWKYCAPSIDVLAPDIYVPDFTGVCEEYMKLGNPLLVPETATHSYAGPREVYSVGHYHAMGYSPFGFEDMGEPFSAQEAYLFGVDTKDPALSTPQSPQEYAWYNRALHEMMPQITEKYGTEDLQAVICERPQQDTMLFGRFGFRVILNHPRLPRNDGVCLIMKESEDTFYIMVNGCALDMFSTDPQKPYRDILFLEEGEFQNGIWKKGRRLNGDEVVKSSYSTPTLLKVKLFAYA